VLSINGVCTLADVVITNPTQIDLVSWAIFFHAVAVTIATQGWFLSRLVPNEHVSPFSCRNF
jgi:hypothetical protein